MEPLNTIGGTNNTSRSSIITGSDKGKEEEGEFKELEEIGEIFLRKGWDGISLAPFKFIDASWIKGYDTKVKWDKLPIIHQIVIERLSKLPNIPSQPTAIHPDPLKNINERLKEGLSAIRNPYLVKKVCEELNKFVGSPIDISDSKGMIVFFSDFNDEITNIFTAFFEDFLEDVSKNSNKIDKVINDFKHELKDISTKLTNSIKDKISKFDKNGEILFGSPYLMRLPNDCIIKLFNLIETIKTPDEFRSEVKILFNDSFKEEELEAYLQQVKYPYNLDTLLGHLIAKKIQNEGIESYWKNPSNIHDKKIEIFDPRGSIHSGIITYTKKDEGIGLSIIVDSQFEVLISSEFQVKIKKEKIMNFWLAIKYKILLSEDEILIHSNFKNSNNGMKNDKNEDDDNFVPNGKYKIEKIEETKKLTRRHTTSYSVFISNSNESYILYCEIDHKTEEIDRISSAKSPKKYFKAQHDYKDFSEFSRYLFSKEVVIPIEGITRENFDKKVIISAKSIATKKTNLLKKLKKYLIENKQVYDDLVKSFCQKKLKDIEIGNDAILASSLEEYSKAFNITKKGLIIKALFESIKDRSILPKTNCLLLDAYRHIQRIKNRSVILFMGDEGSSKKTTVEWLVGAQLTHPQKEDKKLPIEDLKEKEIEEVSWMTPIVKSYETSSDLSFSQSTKPLLSICPEFNGNKTGNIEDKLCAYYSLDETIRNAGKILSLVMLIPASEFYFDKEINILIHYLSIIKETLPGIFDNGNAKSRFFFLITNGNDIKGDFRTKIESDSLLEDLKKSQETSGKKGLFSKPLNEKSEDKDGDGNLINFLISILKNKQLQVLDLKDEEQREDLFTKYLEFDLELDDSKIYIPDMSKELIENLFKKINELMNLWIDVFDGKNGLNEQWDKEAFPLGRRGSRTEIHTPLKEDDEPINRALSIAAHWEDLLFLEEFVLHIMNTYKVDVKNFEIFKAKKIEIAKKIKKNLGWDLQSLKH